MARDLAAAAPAITSAGADLFLIGLIVFTFASILCAAAPSLPWLLVGRGLQGIGAALLMPNSLAMLGASFSGEARGRAIGIWAAVGAFSGALAPLIGGWLVDTSGWRTIFLLNLPVAAAAGFLAWKFVPESKETQESGSLDWVGAVLATLALGLLTWALTAASESAGVLQLSGWLPSSALPCWQRSFGSKRSAVSARSCRLLCSPPPLLSG